MLPPEHHRNDSGNFSHSYRPPNAPFYPNRVQMLPPSHLDLSSIRGETPEHTYLQPFSQANLTQQQISPLIKAEIQQQINLGMQQFFKNLD